jgi:CheY-like chemotaxis protein
VHGWLLSGRLWQPLTEALSPDWECWTPDLPGFGGQPRPRGLQPSLASYGRWLAEAAREQAAERPLVLVGHSLGGSLVVHAAPHLGSQLAGVVQVASGGGVFQPRPFRMVRRGGAAFLRWRPGWLAQLPGTEAIRSPLVAELRAARGLLASSMQRGAVRQLPSLVAQLQVRKIWPQAQISSADGGPQALHLLDAQTFDLALVDMIMPGMDGMQLTQQARTQFGHKVARMPIIALTANTHPSERERCLAAGMDAVLHKPIDSAELVRVVSALVREARA